MRCFEDVVIGEVIPPTISLPITHCQLLCYACASGDFNPLHTDPQSARKAGFDHVIAHGMLVMGFAGQMLSSYFGPGALRCFSVRFRRMTYIGDIITCTGKVVEKQEIGAEGRIYCQIRAHDQHGTIKLLGSCEVSLPYGYIR